MSTHSGIAMPKLGCVYPDTEPWSVPLLRTTEPSFTHGYISVDLVSLVVQKPLERLEVPPARWTGCFGRVSSSSALREK